MKSDRVAPSKSKPYRGSLPLMTKHYSGLAKPRWCTIWLLIAAMQTIPVAAQNTTDAEARGAHRTPLEATTRDGEILELYHQSHALLIGVGSYTDGWSDLPSVERELDQVEQVLLDKQFNVVRLSNPNSHELRQGISQFIDQYGYDHNNRLLFFFSGHGHSEGDKGFLVPSDAPLPDDPRNFRRRALSMNQFMSWARDIEAKHALFLFDSCFSGSVFKSKNLPGVQERYIRRATQKPVRQFITAGSADEVVPARSTFTPTLVNALKGEGDLNHDGYITGSELGVHLSQLVPQFVDQTPQYGKIRDYQLAQGDFVFFNDSDASDPVPSGGENASARDTNRETRLWEYAAQGNSVAEYQAYLDRYPDGLFSGIARARIEQMRRSGFSNEHSTETQLPIEIKGQFAVNITPANARVCFYHLSQWSCDRKVELPIGQTYDIFASASGYLDYQARSLLRQDGEVLRIKLVSGVATPDPTPPERKDYEPEMVFVKGGCYQKQASETESGSNNDEKQDRVCVDDVMAATTETTVAQFRAFVEATSYRTEAEQNVDEQGCYSGKDGNWDWHSGHSWRDPGFKQGDDEPIVCVSWNDAVAYIEWLAEQNGKGYRLPTQAEWEYSAGTRTPLDLNYDNGIANTSPVGLYAANDNGLFDMFGSVSEWTCSQYDEDYGGLENVCKKSDSAGLALLGTVMVSDTSVLSRAVYRYLGIPGGRYSNLGFRVFQDVH